MKKTQTDKRPVNDALETKVITFLGAENGMFPYHVARLLQAARHDINVLVIDNSMSHDLFNMAPGDLDIRTIGKAIVLRDREFTESVFKKFDCVIVYLGETYDQDYVELASQIYFLCNYTPRMESLLAAAELPQDSRSNIIFFDKCTEKIKEEEFLSVVPKETFEDREKNVLVVNYDEKNAFARAEWIWGTHKSLKQMSSEYRVAISTIVAGYFGESVKAVEKVAKNA